MNAFTISFKVIIMNTHASPLFDLGFGINYEDLRFTESF